MEYGATMEAPTSPFLAKSLKIFFPEMEAFKRLLDLLAKYKGKMDDLIFSNALQIYAV